MAESVGVTAVLGVRDKGFTAGMNNARSAVSSLGSSIKGGLGFGALMHIGGSAMSFLGNQVRGLVAEINETNSAWKSFSDNMSMSGMNSKQIDGVKKDLQSFAAQTIYSSKDMASTYAQLYAVNKKTTTSMVKGFGAIAATAENPKQAMKSISQQATQMMAKPTVAWQDFKIMLEQAPAGMAQVAKKMGMSTSELVSAVQDGKVKTAEFLGTMEKLGKDKTLLGMAQQYKTVSQAMDGLRATLSTKLAPAFQAISNGSIKVITALMDRIATRMNILNDAFEGVGKAWGDAFKAIATELGFFDEKTQELKLDEFKGRVEAIANAMKKSAKFVKDHAKAITTLGKILPVVLLAFAGLNKVLKWGDALTKANEPLEKLPGNANPATTAVQGFGGALEKLTKAASISMIIVSIAFLAKALEGIAKTGPSGAVAIAAFGLVVGGLAFVLSKVGTGLTAASIGMLAFGGMVLMVGAGIGIAAAGIGVLVNAVSNLVQQLPIAAEYGLKGAFGIGAMAVSALALAGACATLALTLAPLMVTALATGVGLLLFGAGLVLAGAGAVVLGLALKTVNSTLKSMAKNATITALTLAQMVGSVNLVKGGLSALGGIATTFVNGFKSKMSMAVEVASQTARKINTSLRSASSGAYQAGVYIGAGLARGMRSQIPGVQAAAERLAAAADKAIRAKAKIKSPSRVTAKDGAFIGQGLANGILSKVGIVEDAMASLFAPALPSSNLAFNSGFDMSLNDAYEYNSTGSYNITVVTEIDGKKVAETTAKPMQKELNRLDKQANRAKGII